MPLLLVLLWIRRFDVGGTEKWGNMEKDDQELGNLGYHFCYQPWFNFVVRWCASKRGPGNRRKLGLCTHRCHLPPANCASDVFPEFSSPQECRYDACRYVQQYFNF